MPPLMEMPPPQPAQVGQPGPPPGGPSDGAPQGSQEQGALQMATQHLMEAEQALRAAARVKPELAGIVDNFINQVKPQAGQVLFGSGQGQQSGPQPGIGALLTSGATGLNTQP